MLRWMGATLMGATRRIDAPAGSLSYSGLRQRSEIRQKPQVSGREGILDHHSIGVLAGLEVIFTSFRKSSTEIRILFLGTRLALYGL